LGKGDGAMFNAFGLLQYAETRFQFAIVFNQIRTPRFFQGKIDIGL
jgi:hypothetical protein